MYWLGRWMWENDLKLGHFGSERKLKFNRVMDLLEDGKTGRFRRHPTQPKHNSPEKTSRDQLIPLIAAMGVYRDFLRLDRLRDRIHGKFYGSVAGYVGGWAIGGGVYLANRRGDRQPSRPRPGRRRRLNWLGKEGAVGREVGLHASTAGLDRCIPA
jgi:hypothetical protein